MAASTGSSSMSCAASAPVTGVLPRPSAGAVICTVPTSSECLSSRLSTLICAPSEVSTSSSVARVGLRPSESSRSWSRERARRRRGRMRRRRCLRERRLRWPAALRAGDGDGVPSCARPWLRRRAGPVRCGRGCGCFADGGGAAVCRPASRTQVLTCALGTGVV
jgi:hypothetical protein